MKKLITILLLTLLINVNFTTNANAFGGEIRIMLRAIGKFLKGGADESIKVGNKTLDDLFKKISISTQYVASVFRDPYPSNLGSYDVIRSEISFAAHLVLLFYPNSKELCVTGG